eukprot:748716-Hanusia_phi.AAC.2
MTGRQALGAAKKTPSAVARRPTFCSSHTQEALSAMGWRRWQDDSAKTSRRRSFGDSFPGETHEEWKENGAGTVAEDCISACALAVDGISAVAGAGEEEEEEEEDGWQRKSSMKSDR